MAAAEVEDLGARKCLWSLVLVRFLLSANLRPSCNCFQQFPPMLPRTVVGHHVRRISPSIPPCTGFCKSPNHGLLASTYRALGPRLDWGFLLVNSPGVGGLDPPLPARTRFAEMGRVSARGPGPAKYRHQVFSAGDRFGGGGRAQTSAPSGDPARSDGCGRRREGVPGPKPGAGCAHAATPLRSRSGVRRARRNCLCPRRLSSGAGCAFRPLPAALQGRASLQTQLPLPSTRGAGPGRGRGQGRGGPAPSSGGKSERRRLLSDVCGTQKNSKGLGLDMKAESTLKSWLPFSSSDA
ncbi:PREDICTED: translation initiation factor IF-2-like [Chinchilla lanigera]|uniref:translation initiation factor IF-2-like n=1 Tax=Chinchilla lanigera TaxID=34839 RepID=UPI00038EE8D5|nr:PREDICTED: translation initiation factor IF-2-like [Chinchilla lanigera]